MVVRVGLDFGCSIIGICNSGNVFLVADAEYFSVNLSLMALFSHVCLLSIVFYQNTKRAIPFTLAFPSHLCAARRHKEITFLQV